MILVGIPYHRSKRYALNHIIDWAEQQTHKDADVVMRLDMGEYGRKDAIKEQMEFFRKLSLSDDKYSHLYIMEADTIPPLDVLDKLLAHDTDVIGALCRYRSPDKPIVAWPKENVTLGLCEVEGMGTAAVLLSRKALESFTFFDWVVPDPDYPLYETLRMNGFSVFLDADLICKHYLNEKEYA